MICFEGPQLRILASPFVEPRNAPYFFIACSVYCEQEGR